MILLVPAYHPPDRARRGEIELCLRANLAHQAIRRVCLFGDPGGFPDHPRLIIVPGTDRHTFDALFAYAAAEWAGEVVIVANADIYFDATLELAAGIGRDELYALSRWNPTTGRISGSTVAEDGAVCIPLSIGADAWIFRAPLPALGADFTQGRPFCDHRLARIALDAGLRVTNPSLSVRAWHMHATALRTYTHADTIAGPYAWLLPTLLFAPAAITP